LNIEFLPLPVDPSQLAMASIDGKVEHGEVADAALHLELGPD